MHEDSNTTDDHRRSSRRMPAPGAGLVLLYAEDYRALASAFPLSAPSLIIGREPPKGGIVIPQRAVSRMHARIGRVDNEWVVSDLNSRNGVTLNGAPIKNALLRPNDEVCIGQAIFKFVADDIGEYARFGIDGRPLDGRSAPACPAMIGGY